MADIGSRAENSTELLGNLKQIIDCVRKLGLKLSTEKCIFGTTESNLLGNILTPAGI